MSQERIERVIDRALAEHDLVVTEPPRGYYVNREGEILKKGKRDDFGVATSSQESPHTALNIIKYIEDGLEWRLSKPYTNSANLKVGGFSWCGAFASWCDLGLKREIRRKTMPSTYRLYEFCKSTARDIPLDEIQRGDIVIVGRPSGKRWGAHITRALEVGDTHVLCIEGNAHGTLGNGTWGEGVIVRRRPFKGYGADKESVIMHAYRFLDSDYED